MGYRSQVRSLIYGDPDLICALVARCALTSTSTGANPLKEFSANLRRYRTNVRAYDREATLAQEPDAEGGRKSLFVDKPIEILDLYGDDWKWYSIYPDVQAWEQLLIDAYNSGLNTEFVRIGDESNDIEIIRNFQDDWCNGMISVSSTIVDDVPEDVELVDYSEEVR